MFDYIISLGDNCETGLVLRYAGINQSSLFRFAYTGIDKINSILENSFKDIYKYENLVPSFTTMVTDVKYNISFHTKMLSTRKNEKWEFDLNEDERKLIYNEELKKQYYLIEKWEHQRKSGKILYIIKSNNDKLNNENINRLLNNLDKLEHMKGYKLLVLIDVNSKFTFNHPNVIIRRMQRFADFRDAFDFHFKSWKRILKEFCNIEFNYTYE